MTSPALLLVVLLCGGCARVSSAPQKTAPPDGHGRHVCAYIENNLAATTSRLARCETLYVTYVRRCGTHTCRAVKSLCRTKSANTNEIDAPSTGTTRVVFACCPGWTQSHSTSTGCLIPVCDKPCHNGGTCVGPQTCRCPAGHTGRLCENDIDECSRDKPCDQTCRNTIGSFACECRDGFTLADDGQSCRINDHTTAIEATDMEYDDFRQRILQLETSRETDGKALAKMHYRIEQVSKEIGWLKARLDELTGITKLQRSTNVKQSRFY